MSNATGWKLVAQACERKRLREIERDLALLLCQRVDTGHEDEVK